MYVCMCYQLQLTTVLLEYEYDVHRGFYNAVFPSVLTVGFLFCLRCMQIKDGLILVTLIPTEEREGTHC